MAKSGSVVAPESPFSSGRMNDDGAIDGRIAEKGFVRERKRVSKTLGNNRGRKANIFFGFVRGCTLRIAVAGLRTATLGGGYLGNLVLKKVSRVQISVVPEVPTLGKAPTGAGFLISWMRALTSNEALSTEEVAGIGKVEGRNWTVFPKRVPLVVGT